MDNLASLELNDVDFSSIRKMVLENTGISLSSAKKELVKRRFKPRLKDLGLASFSSYIKYVRTNHDSEITNFCNAITTNLTSFFRENHHYEFLKEEGLPKLMKKNASSRKLRIWSAGCSTGQEAYCLAMTLRETIPGIERWDIKILATDLDEKCLADGRAGVYATNDLNKESMALISKYFVEAAPELQKHNKKMMEAKPELKEMITFNKLNLMTPWPMKANFDVIFCRNVFIYFEKDVQVGLVDRYSKLQSKDSYLCLGHSETLADPSAVGYHLMGKTQYIRE